MKRVLSLRLRFFFSDVRQGFRRRHSNASIEEKEEESQSTTNPSIISETVTKEEDKTRSDMQSHVQQQRVPHPLADLDVDLEDGDDHRDETMSEDEESGQMQPLLGYQGNSLQFQVFASCLM